MDRFTIDNLELYQTSYTQGVSLLQIIDKTLSPMGGRLLKRWLALPLKNLQQIQQRQEIVTYFYLNDSTSIAISEELKQIGDLERLISKVAAAKISPRELVQLKRSLLSIQPIKELLQGSNQKAIQELAKKIHSLEDLISQIDQCLNEEAPVVIGKGITIAEGYHQELDELRGIAYSGKDYLDQMLVRETERTGIGALKIASNNVFGYYIEVRNTHKDKVPEQWIRKQTLVNAERYITEELKEYETKILGAEEQILSLEQQLFAELVIQTQNNIKEVQQNAHILAQIDCLNGFAILAHENDYHSPKLDESYQLNIKDGRHPVIEQQLPIDEAYIANDLFLDREKQQLIVITGPNMSGKSATLRQTALIVLLAQMGSFVPAKEAHIGIVDKIFTRVGASDNISKGESTFMVEMNETASILNNLSDRSLIILDEIGRGTSTYDGISIAWAIAEYLHQSKERPKTLFATHYHELNEMEKQFDRIHNYNVSIEELKDKVLFKRKLIPGGSAHSFGIHVAKMAGMPQQVLNKANAILKKLEATHGTEHRSESINELAEDMQLSFFQLDDPTLEAIKEELLETDINNLTPVEALNKLNAIKNKLSNK
jgi:DNA mismatch repair protein MutS